LWNGELARDEKRLIRCPPYGGLNNYIMDQSILARVLFFTPSYFNFDVQSVNDGPVIYPRFMLRLQFIGDFVCLNC